ncbi:MAG: carboxylating nicotinate-nucleotide diphosphorylase [Nitrospirota bacterium]|nr:MAG: carboxylating nicotinate-nucleotide diphosphorylase [Nitrospirota bacterium]
MRAPSPRSQHIRAIIQAALNEDLPHGDITTEALFPDAVFARAVVVANEGMTLAGLGIAHQVFREIDPSLKIKNSRKDGETVRPNTTLFIIEGDARSILKGERVALNFLQHLSGISTLTARFCKAVKGYSTKILDTRKTTPGLRVLQKWAVRLGGGTNHRYSLSDGILIKDNHLALLQSQGLGIEDACHLSQKRRPHHRKITVEAETFEQVRMAIKGNPDVILLDNMTPKMVAKAVKLIKGLALVEVSGGITLKNVRHMATAGANFISIGALTHSAPAMNLSLNFSIPKKRTRRLPR